MRVINHRLDYGQPWSTPDIYLFTGNPIRKANGALVMGRGAAQAVRDRWPSVQYHIKTDRPVTFHQINPDQWIGWFQVKHHWQHPAEPDLIQRSATYLASIATKRPNHRFHINAPGIGNGRLDWQQVEPLLSMLPDNVLVYI